MPLYTYRCPEHGEVEIRHSMMATGTPQKCPQCGVKVARVVTAPHHWWPAQFRPGFEESGQRQLLDPEYQARAKDELAQAKEARK